MRKEAYEHPSLGVELFEAVDVLTSSSTGVNPPDFQTNSPWELPLS